MKTIDQMIVESRERLDSRDLFYVHRLIDMNTCESCREGVEIIAETFVGIPGHCSEKIFNLLMFIRHTRPIGGMS